MDSDKYSRDIELHCPTCGGTQFEYGDDIDNDQAYVTCIGCERTMAKDELIQENSENIDEHVQEVGKEAVDDMKKKIKGDLKKALKGNKNITIK